MKQSFKPVIENVLEVILTNLQVHTTKFVTFTTQKPSDIQVMMLAVRSHAHGKPGKQRRKCNEPSLPVPCDMQKSHVSLAGLNH